MYTFFYCFRQLLQWLRGLAVLSFVCLILGWSLPAQASELINPQMEQQVLQIIREHPQAILESLEAYRQKIQQKVQQSQQSFLKDLKTAPEKIIGGSPSTGSPKAKILIVEFSDFQCPYCAEAHKTLNELIDKHQNDVTLVYKNFPITQIHPEAMPAAKAAWAAFKQGKFWEYNNELFTHQNQLGEKLYLEIAKNLNLDLLSFEQDRRGANTAINQDIELAEKLGVSGTPFFVLNSESFSGAVQLSDIKNILSRISH